MTLLDYQLSFRGLVMGDGTDYVPSSLDGLQSTPGVRTGDTDRARRHGQFAGADYATGRSITASIQIDAVTSGIDEVLSAFSAAHVVADPGEYELRAKIPGLASGAEVLVRARCRRLSLPIDNRYASGAPLAEVQWWATDPRIYSAEATVLSASMAAVTGSGLVFPATFPLTFGGSTAGGFILPDNVGEFPAPWTAIIDGPIVNPRIENVTTGQTISFVGSLALGESLHLDSDLRSVLLGGTASRYSWLASGSQWFDLDPGPNTIRLAGTSGEGSMTLMFRSAWI